MDVEIKTKFNIGDICCGFFNRDIHTLRIDRIDICTEKFTNDKDCDRVKITYYATTIDSKVNLQDCFNENQLFTDEEVISHIIDYFKNRKIVIK